MRSSCRSSSPRPRLSPNCSAYATRRSEWPFREFCFESTLRANANTADIACSSMYFLSCNRVWTRPSKSQCDAGLAQISIAPASRPRWMSQIRGRFQQNDWRELIERIFLDLTAKFETADVWQAVVQENQIRLYLQAASDCRFAICRRIYVALLALQERFQSFAIRRNNIHEHDGRVHASLTICPRKDG